SSPNPTKKEMQILKALVFACLLAVALARPNNEDHRARKLAAMEETERLLADDMIIKRCELHTDRKPCPGGSFCLSEDWRCFLSDQCEHKGGWCFPTVKPSAAMFAKEERIYQEKASFRNRDASADENSDSSE
ncbi:hypothetical protein PFISCL1PPCAC_17880, partial [Pristionchus fissidentatus]